MTNIILFILILIKSSFAQELDFKKILNGHPPTTPFVEIGFSLKDCQTGQFGNQPVKQEKRAWLPELAPIDKNCRPDTLYSWGSLKKIQHLKNQMGLEKWDDQFHQSLFATILPVGTFYYGLMPIRIKLKKNLRFKQIYRNGCKLEKESSQKEIKDNQRTVYYDVRAISDGGPNPSGEYLYDIILCSPYVIESWSYGLKEHYAETIRDLKWITDKSHHGQFVSYIQLRNGEPGIDINFGNRPFVKYFTHTKRRRETQNIDGHEVNRESLYNSLIHFYQIVTNNEGEIFYNPQSEEEKSLKEHFSTNRKNYFND
jgi:hypothetical protein